MARNGDGQFAIAFALLQVAEQICRLGNGDGVHPMGAIEAFSNQFSESMGDVAASISAAMDDVANAIREHGKDE